MARGYSNSSLTSASDIDQPSYQPGKTVLGMVGRGSLEPACADTFWTDQSKSHPRGAPTTLHVSKQQAVDIAGTGQGSSPHSYP